MITGMAELPESTFDVDREFIISFDDLHFSRYSNTMTNIFLTEHEIRDIFKRMQDIIWKVEETPSHEDSVRKIAGSL